MMLLIKTVQIERMKQKTKWKYICHRRWIDNMLLCLWMQFVSFASILLQPNIFCTAPNDIIFWIRTFFFAFSQIVIILCVHMSSNINDDDYYSVKIATMSPLTQLMFAILAAFQCDPEMIWFEFLQWQRRWQMQF